MSAARPSQAASSRGARDGFLLRLLVILAIGATGGLGSAAWALRDRPGFGRVDIGPWSTWPRIGGFDIDPYARATIMRRGELPLGTGEGLVLLATHDSDGRPLNGRCAYRLSGWTPLARAFTLTQHRPDGHLFLDRPAKHGLASGEIVREPDGSLLIALARGAEPGNWLPLATDGPFTLALRLYDTAASSISRGLDAAQLPRIQRTRCI